MQIIRPLVAAALIAALTGCANGLTEGANPSAEGSSPPTEAVREVAQMLTHAIAEDDLASFQNAASLPEHTWDSLRDLASVEFIPVTNQRWRVDESIDGTHHASYLIHVDVDCASRCQVTGMAQQPSFRAPLWISEAVSVTHPGEGIWIETGSQVSAASSESPRTRHASPAGQSAGPGDAAVPEATASDEWSEAILEAVEAMGASTLSSLLDGAPLIVEIPATTQAFEQRMAAPALDFRSSGAITTDTTFSLDCADTCPQEAINPPSEVRVIINPDVMAQATHRDRVRLVAHEFTHVRTRHLAPEVSPHREWVWEGLAENVAMQAVGERPLSLEDVLTVPATPTTSAGEAGSSAAPSVTGGDQGTPAASAAPEGEPGTPWLPSAPGGGSVDQGQPCFDPAIDVASRDPQTVAKGYATSAAAVAVVLSHEGEDGIRRLLTRENDPLPDYLHPCG